MKRVTAMSMVVWTVVLRQKQREEGHSYVHTYLRLSMDLFVPLEVRGDGQFNLQSRSIHCEDTATQDISWSECTDTSIMCTYTQSNASNGMVTVELYCVELHRAMWTWAQAIYRSCSTVQIYTEQCRKSDGQSTSTGCAK